MRGLQCLFDPARQLACLIVFLLAFSPAYARPAQQTPTKLKIRIIEGEGAINNIRQRTAREPIVQVEDENDRPVAGVAVVFILPESGAGGTFPNQARSLTVMTDSRGRAVARGFRPNDVSGKYQIQVEASYQDLMTTTAINQSNAVLTAAGAGGISGKLIAILAIAGGAAAAGVVAATSGDGGKEGGTPAPTPTVITPGTPSVGAP